MRKEKLLAAALAGIAGCALGGSALAQTNGDAGGSSDDGSASTTLEIASGLDYSSGDYGAVAETTVWSIPLDLKLQSGRVRLQASLPYVFVKGPGQIVGGVVVSSPNSTDTASRSGIGDLNLTAAITAVKENGAIPTIELGGSVKVPTASSLIGTGKADYSATASLYKTVSSGVMLFGSVGYSWLGSPDAYVLENGITASGGLNYRPADNQNYGVSMAYREPVAAGLQGQAVVSPYMTYRFSKRLGFTLYGMAGLNDASPRIGAGIRLSVFN
jgi:hypothetical protein